MAAARTALANRANRRPRRSCSIRNHPSLTVIPSHAGTVNSTPKAREKVVTKLRYGPARNDSVNTDAANVIKKRNEAGIRMAKVKATPIQKSIRAVNSAHPTQRRWAGGRMGFRYIHISYIHTGDVNSNATVNTTLITVKKGSVGDSVNRAGCVKPPCTLGI